MFPDSRFVSARTQLTIRVLATTFDGTRAALTAAIPLTRGCRARLVVLVPQVVPYPLPLDAPAEPTPFTAERYRTLLQRMRCGGGGPRLPVPTRRRRASSTAAVARDSRRRRRGRDVARQPRRAARATLDPSWPPRRLRADRGAAARGGVRARRVPDVRDVRRPVHGTLPRSGRHARSGHGPSRRVRAGSDQPGTASADRGPRSAVGGTEERGDRTSRRRRRHQRPRRRSPKRPKCGGVDVSGLPA